MRRLPLILSVIIAAFLLTATLQRGLTQDTPNSCPTVVRQALEAVGNNCGGLSRNSACYGFNRVNATFANEVNDDFFSKPSDQTALNTLQSIDTAALNESIQEWGVAVMSVQANIPNSLPGQAISFILLGDVQLDNAVPESEAVQPAETPIAVTVINDSNIRTLPSTSSNILGSVVGGAALSADATNPTKDWVRVVLNNEQPGWISRPLVQTDGDLDSLPVFDTSSRTPMQAFYFKTGIGTPACTQSPDVLVVQGPERVAVDITANGANIRIGSTIALRNVGDNQMQVITISGEAEVEGVPVPAGYATTLPLNTEGTGVTGSPSSPEKLPNEELEALEWLEDVPTDVLNYPINIPDPQPQLQITITVPSNGAVGQSAPAVNCAPFRATSPLDGLNYGMNTFYWDAAPGATTYRVNVDGAGSKEVPAPTTNMTFDISSIGFNPQLTWSVEALYNGRVVCSSQSVTIPRAWAPTPPPTVPPPNLAPGAPTPVPPPFNASWSCNAASFTVNFDTLPAGTTSVTVNYTATGTFPFPGSGATVSVPPDPGSIFFSSYPPGTYTLTGGVATANPGGQSVGLPDLSCS
ncbi:MAG: SH3 domain-containing protein [Chloroflexi bacterium]|nr:SH3 domain-containing protein [Chloroflexota bacterium]MCC6893707.1 SH3 domain-containing protein [Anaerolineae bacterium]